MLGRHAALANAGTLRAMHQCSQRLSFLNVSTRLNDIPSEQMVGLPHAYGHPRSADRQITKVMAGGSVEMCRRTDWRESMFETHRGCLAASPR